MSYLVLSENLKKNLANLLDSNNDVNKTIEHLKAQKDFVFLVESLKKILYEEKYVVLKNTPFQTKIHLQAFINFFGKFYGEIEFTGIKINCTYTGCATSKLVLHNDDAIDLKNQPKIGFIQVIKEDPLLTVTNGIVVIRELIQKLRYEDPTLLESLLTKKVPMLSLGINYDSDDKSLIEIKSPILYKEDNQYKVRFDFNRIMFFYQYHKIKQSFEEGQMIYKFLQHCESLKKTILINKGDILIHNNKSTLHDRTPCSIGIDTDQNLFTREIYVSFAS